MLRDDHASWATSMAGGWLPPAAAGTAAAKALSAGTGSWRGTGWRGGRSRRERLYAVSRCCWVVVVVGGVKRGMRHWVGVLVRQREMASHLQAGERD